MVLEVWPEPTQVEHLAWSSLTKEKSFMSFQPTEEFFRNRGHHSQDTLPKERLEFLGIE